MEIQLVEMGIQSQITPRNSKENVAIVEPRDTRKLTVGKKRRMLTSAQRIGNEGTQELK